MCVLCVQVSDLINCTRQLSSRMQLSIVVMCVFVAANFPLSSILLPVFKNYLKSLLSRHLMSNFQSSQYFDPSRLSFLSRSVFNSIRFIVGARSVHSKKRERNAFLSLVNRHELDELKLFVCFALRFYGKFLILTRNTENTLSLIFS